MRQTLELDDRIDINTNNSMVMEFVSARVSTTILGTWAVRDGEECCFTEECKISNREETLIPSASATGSQYIEPRRSVVRDEASSKHQ